MHVCAIKSESTLSRHSYGFCCIIPFHSNCIQIDFSNVHLIDKNCSDMSRYKVSFTQDDSRASNIQIGQDSLNMDPREVSPATFLGR